MQQIIIGGAAGLSTTAARYPHLQGGSVNANTTGSGQVVSVAGVFSGLRIRLSAAPGTSKSYTFRLVKNGVNTDIVVVISGTDTTGIDSAHTASVVAGDYLWLSCTPSGTPDAADYSSSIVFTGDSALVMGAPRNGTGSYDTNYVALMCASAYVTSSETIHRQVIPTNGTIGSLYVRTHAAITSGQTLTFTLRVNGVDSALTCTIPNSGQTANDTTHGVSVSAGDIVTLKMVGTPSGAGRPAVFPTWGVTFVPDIAGESILMNNPSGSMHQTNVEYNCPSSKSQIAWGVTESNYYQLANDCKVGKFHVLLSATPQADNSYTLTIRDDGADTSVAVTISDTDTTGNNTADVAVVAAGSVLSVKSNPNTTTPRVSVAYWGFAMNPVVTRPTDAVARVSSIRHICRPGFCRMQVGLGDLGFDVDVAEATVRKALDTAINIYGGVGEEPYGPKAPVSKPAEPPAMDRMIEEERRLREAGAEAYRRQYTGMQLPPPQFEEIRQFPGPPKPKTLWQKITPWKEERGETFLSEVKERWRAITPWKEEVGETFGGEVVERIESMRKWIGGLFK